MQFISGVKVVHAADKAERHRHRLLRQDDAKPWSKESAAIKIDDLPLREVRGLLTLDGLASGRAGGGDAITQIITPRENAGFAKRPHRGHNTSRA